MNPGPLAVLEEKIAGRTFTLGVIGLGYVGLPVALAFLTKGIRVLGFDRDPSRVESLLQGGCNLKNIDGATLSEAVAEGRFVPTTDPAKLAEPDALLITVPTPLAKNREPDLRHVRESGEAIGRHMRPGQLIVLESTTYPGTTEEVLRPILEQSGLQSGRDFFLAYSPERVDPGNMTHDLTDIPKLVGGSDEVSGRLVRKLYETAFKQVVAVSSTRVAEMAKLLENIFRSVNIALVNELKMLCLRMEIDIWEVIGAASTKPFGFMPFYPGPGLGGHCIPIDPFYLTSKAREYDTSTKFIELAGEVNTFMPYFVAQRVMDALNGHGKALRGASILVLGVAYKKDVDDCRESPAFKLIEILRSRGGEVSFNDPHVGTIQLGESSPVSLASLPLTSETLAEADCILVTTDHSAYDYDFIYQHARLIVDSRNVYGSGRDTAGKVVPA